MYDPIMDAIHDSKVGSAPIWKRLLVGSICGMMGALSCNPFELVKTRYEFIYISFNLRLQSAASGTIVVGHQHGYTGVWQGLEHIIKSDGLSGLYRGSLLSIARSAVGSGANLAVFSIMKVIITRINYK